MKFIRRGWYKHKRLGKGKRRKVGWRKPKGRDNKMRESRKGKPGLVSIGWKKSAKTKKTLIVRKLSDMEKAKNFDVIIVGKMGKKKKIEIVKKAEEMKIKLGNINARRLLKGHKTENKK